MPGDLFFERGARVVALRFIGYAIVSDDGMLADADGLIPPSLIVPADQSFFMRGLDTAAALVHGRNSAEQPTSPARRRLIATRTVAATAADPAQPHALFWNPRGATVEAALAELGVRDGDIAVVGGTEVFGLFLPRYDVFHLTRVQGVMLPGGRPVFPGVPARPPEALLAETGLRAGAPETLDAARDVSVVAWTRAPELSGR